MPPKKWSRKEEEKRLKDRMTDIKNSCSTLAKLSKEREDALQAAVPGIHPQQENDFLDNAAAWGKFYDDDIAWLREKAELEAEQILQTNKDLLKIELEHAALRVQLEELVLIKKEPEVEKAEWDAIFAIRDLMIQHPKMVRAFFDTDYLGKLQKTIETILEDLDRRIEALKGSVFDAINISRDEVKEFLDTDFNVRLGDAIEDVRTAHTETIEKNQELKGLYEDVTARLERRDVKLAESQEANKKALEDVENLNQRLSELQTSHDILTKNSDLSNKHNAQLLASFDTNQESHRVALSSEEEAHKEAVRGKDELQIKLDKLRSEFKNLSERSSQEALIHQADGDTIKGLETDLAQEKRKLGVAKERATRDSDEIISLKAKLDEERENLRKATLQHQEKASQYSLLARLKILKTSAIQARPVEELEAIVGRAVGFTQSTSNIEAARLLDSTNTDLPEGTQLIADAPDVFILIDSNTVTIFDKADIQGVEFDSTYKMRMVMCDDSLSLCSTPFDLEKSVICESWMGRYGVVLTKVVEIG